VETKIALVPALSVPWIVDVEVLGESLQASSFEKSGEFVAGGIVRGVGDEGPQKGYLCEELIKINKT
jgi:hypothetical protein